MRGIGGVLQVLHAGAVGGHDPAVLFAAGGNESSLFVGYLQEALERRQGTALVIEEGGGAFVVFALPAGLHHPPQLVVDPCNAVVAGGQHPLSLHIDHAHAIRAQRRHGLAVLKVADVAEGRGDQFLAGHKVVQAPRGVCVGALQEPDHAWGNDVRLEDIGQVIGLALAVDHPVDTVSVDQRIAVAEIADMLLHRQAHRPALGIQQLQAAVGLGGKAQLVRLQRIVAGLGFRVAVAAVSYTHLTLPTKRIV